MIAQRIRACCVTSRLRGFHDAARVQGVLCTHPSVKTAVVYQPDISAELLGESEPPDNLRAVFIPKSDCEESPVDGNELRSFTAKYGFSGTLSRISVLVASRSNKGESVVLPELLSGVFSKVDQDGDGRILVSEAAGFLSRHRLAHVAKLLTEDTHSILDTLNIEGEEGLSLQVSD